MRWVAFVLTALVLTAGCFGQVGVEGDDGDGSAASPGEGGPGGDAATQTVTRRLVFQENISDPRPGGDRVGVSWPAEMSIGLTAMHLELSWETTSNAFGVETERPDGTVHTLPPPAMPGQTSTEGDVTELVPGEYTYHLTAGDGVVLPDTVRLVVTATFELSTTTQPALEEGTVRDPVQVEETEDGYRATVTYRANASAQDRMQVTVDTTNGEIRHDGQAEGATGTVTAWAHGDTADEARQRVLAIDVDLVVDEGRIQAIATAPDWTQRGASVSIGVPETTTVHGSLDTTNGPIHIEDARAEDLTADTTNGGITGSITGQGDYLFDTTNGAISVDLAPTGTSSLEADTTNGPIVLGLVEGDEIAYEIDAETTNGRITESMSEARLEGSDEEATLVTEDGQDRPIQVTGLADTTNGNVVFEGR